MAVTLFVSHAPADDGFARALTQALIEAGVDARPSLRSRSADATRQHEIILRDCSLSSAALTRRALLARARAGAPLL